MRKASGITESKHRRNIMTVPFPVVLDWSRVRSFSLLFNSQSPRQQLAKVFFGTGYKYLFGGRAMKQFLTGLVVAVAAAVIGAFGAYLWADQEFRYQLEEKDRQLKNLKEAKYGPSDDAQWEIQKLRNDVDEKGLALATLKKQHEEEVDTKLKGNDIKWQAQVKVLNDEIVALKKSPKTPS